MAESRDTFDNGVKPHLALDTRRALADIRYNSIIAADSATSSEDEEPESQGIPRDDARNAIGVSISRAQTRLTSPQTPAAEKAAAINGAGGFFGNRYDGTGDALEEDEGEEDDADEADVYEKRGSQRADVRLPSPWRAQPKQLQLDSKDGGRLSGFLAGLPFGRRRAASGPDEGWTKSFLSNLPSLPKSFAMNSYSSHASSDEPPRQEEVKRSKRTTSLGSSKELTTNSSRESQQTPTDGRIHALRRQVTAEEYEEVQATVGDLPKRNELRRIPSRPVALRRSTSDGSLVTMRTLSMAESLGDDSRFENVQDQVNSRLKAIRDSWQDSNIKLPSMPNFNVSSITPDFLRERSGSLNKKHHLRQGSRDADFNVAGNTTKSERPTDPMTRQPYHSAKAAMSDAAANKQTSHPHFTRALYQLEGDIVILGGYRGSILRSAEPPHRQLWVPVKVGLNLRKANLEVGIEEDSDERAVDTIIPDGMLTHIGPVDMSRRLFKRLRACENTRTGTLRVHDYGYDWRLHPTHLSQQLIKFLETLPCNKAGVAKEKRGAIVIAHSLGGLITRHAVNQRPDLFRGVVYAGVPRTCVNILGPLRNGDEVLLSSRVLTAQVNFTIRTSFVLLPLDGRCFFDKNTKEEYPVDFFDPQTWIDYRLSPCVARPLPPLVPSDKPSGITGYVSSMASALTSLPIPGRKGIISRPKTQAGVSNITATASGAAEPETMASTTGGREAVVADENIDKSAVGSNEADYALSNGGPVAIGTAVTLPRDKAVEYLTRTLATVKKFKQDLAFNPAHAASNAYPPISVIYGKSTPTVYGAKVDGREGIKHADAYDELAFASGDGVVLARAAMVPEGYKTVRGGLVSSERGHVTLLGDLEAVGACLNAILAAGRRGVGWGSQ